MTMRLCNPSACSREQSLHQLFGLFTRSESFLLLVKAAGMPSSTAGVTPLSYKYLLS